ncbi:LysR family transcriptional regulator [Methylobacterium oryzisoli]
MTDPDIQTLRPFLSIFDLRNLRRAAERHTIAPSAVTRRLSELERHDGVTLFDRRPRGVEPTHAGEELARHVRDLLTTLGRIRADSWTIVRNVAEGRRIWTRRSGTAGQNAVPPISPIRRSARAGSAPGGSGAWRAPPGPAPPRRPGRPRPGRRPSPSATSVRPAPGRGPPWRRGRAGSARSPP